MKKNIKATSVEISSNRTTSVSVKTKKIKANNIPKDCMVKKGKVLSFKFVFGFNLVAVLV